MSSSRMRGRTATVAVLAGSAIALAAGPAAAHVTVQPDTATKGGYSTVAFKVPNEQDGASTIRIEVSLPADHPIASVSLQPVPGWTAHVTTSKLSTPLKTDDGTVDRGVTRITWSGGKIAPGQFQQFPVSLGPLPGDTGALVFKTLQTYDNGDVVRWIEVPRKGQPEPENPAPELTLVDAAGGPAAGSTGPAPAAGANATGSRGPAAAASTGADATGATSSSDGTARALGTAGIAVGVLGVGFGVFAGRRRGTPGDGSSTGSSGGAAHPSA